jgi:GT2 family glycosyltransferase
VYEVDGIANCFMIRKSVALLARLIPSSRIPWNGEDGYLQYKVKELGYKLAIVGRAKVFHDVDQIKYSMRPNMFYYALRSKIFFHKDLDSRLHYFIFQLSLPIYVVYYLNMAIRSKNVAASTKALFSGLIDGIRNREGVFHL